MAQKQYITFYLDEHLFGLDIILVREINRNMDITVVDRAPEYVRGLMNLRGQIVTVLDLGSRLGLEQRTITAESRCIVLKPQAEVVADGSNDALHEELSHTLVGLLVDRIGDVVSVDEKIVDPPPAHAGGVKGKYLDGVVKLEDHLLITLSAVEILTQTE